MYEVWFVYQSFNIIISGRGGLKSKQDDILVVKDDAGSNKCIFRAY